MRSPHRRVLPFPHQARLRWRANPIQPRRGARMALRAETAGLRVYTAHIESGKNDAFRRKQLAHLAAEEETTGTACTPLVVAGDFNCGPFGHVPMLDMLHDRGFADALNGDPHNRRTSVGRRHALDWIFVRQLAVSSGGVVHVTPDPITSRSGRRCGDRRCTEPGEWKPTECATSRTRPVTNPRAAANPRLSPAGIPLACQRARGETMMGPVNTALVLAAGNGDRFRNPTRESKLCSLSSAVAHSSHNRNRPRGRHYEVRDRARLSRRARARRNRT